MEGWPYRDVVLEFIASSLLEDGELTRKKVLRGVTDLETAGGVGLHDQPDVANELCEGLSDVAMFDDERTRPSWLSGLLRCLVRPLFPSLPCHPCSAYPGAPFM
jgi:hypothetical protein